LEWTRFLLVFIKHCSPHCWKKTKRVMKGVAIRKRGGGRRMNFVVGVGRDVIG
jgi:hypothetical protein